MLQNMTSLGASSTMTLVVTVRCDYYVRPAERKLYVSFHGVYTFGFHVNPKKGHTVVCFSVAKPKLVAASLAGSWISLAGGEF